MGRITKMCDNSDSRTHKDLSSFHILFVNFNSNGAFSIYYDPESIEV